jgi:hypothetical protein|tara:strand:- start:218 stop:571 length:354 start_codon:yes stop_codon:yes gene_type:complete
MIRLTIKQAVLYLIDSYKKMNANASKNVVKAYMDKVKAMHPIELGTLLKNVSNDMMALKGTREATNISFAPNETQTTYKEAESMVGTLARFVGKDGLEYECGVYCKKVVIKKGTEKK